MTATSPQQPQAGKAAGTALPAALQTFVTIIGDLRGQGSCQLSLISIWMISLSVGSSLWIKPPWREKGRCPHWMPLWWTRHLNELFCTAPKRLCGPWGNSSVHQTQQHIWHRGDGMAAGHHRVSPARGKMARAPSWARWGCAEVQNQTQSAGIRCSWSSCNYQKQPACTDLRASKSNTPKSRPQNTLKKRATTY